MSDDQRILVMTGGSSGFGRRMIERLLAERPEWRIILLARHSPRVEALKADTAGSDRLTIVDADLSNLTSVAHGAATVTDLLQGRSIDTLVLNAGIQVVDTDGVSAEGIEITFAVNHLAHFVLADSLTPRMKSGGRVIFTSSEVHDPAAFCLIGIARATWQEPEELADSSRSQMHQPVGVERGEARYSASKLLNLLTARHFARTETRFSTLAFNPSVVPGTDIARHRNIFQIFGWKYFLPILAPILPGVRTMERSAEDLFWLATEADAEALRGQYVNGRTVEPGSDESRDERKIAAVVKTSRALVAEKLSVAPRLIA